MFKLIIYVANVAISILFTHCIWLSRLNLRKFFLNTRIIIRNCIHSDILLHEYQTLDSMKLHCTLNCKYKLRNALLNLITNTRQTMIKLKN